MKKQETTTLAPMTVFEKLVENDPFLTRPFNDVFLRQALSVLVGSGLAGTEELQNWWNKALESLQPVPVDVTETEDQLTVKAKVPGFTEKEIELRVDPQRLYIRARHEESSEEKKDKSVSSERRSNEIYREFPLPAEIDPNKVEATVTNGVLEVKLARRQKPKKVEVAKKAAA
ncbi:MAG: Hsp20/alpha crystallin family protein [Candidatus Korobacteraceae bacterium]|jgi:HSP20 family protein